MKITFNAPEPQPIVETTPTQVEIPYSGPINYTVSNNHSGLDALILAIRNFNPGEAVEPSEPKKESFDDKFAYLKKFFGIHHE